MGQYRGNLATVGITDYAQSSLGDIVYVELPEMDREVEADEELITIESVKAAESIHCPLPGKITKVNANLDDSPETINEDPYDAFLFILELSNSKSIDNLLTAEQYSSFLSTIDND